MKKDLIMFKMKNYLMIFIVFMCIPIFANWSQYQYDSKHNGINTNELIKVPLNFSWKLIDNISTMNYFSPLIFNNMIFQVQSDGTISKINLETGIREWSKKIDAGVFTTSAIQDNKIYLGSEKGFLYSFDVEIQKIEWNFFVGNNINAPPTLNENNIYFTANDGYVYALSKAGQLIWKKELGGYIVSSPAILKDKMIVTAFDGVVYCLNKYSGVIFWSYDTQSIIKSSPSVDDNSVFVSTYNGNLYSFDVDSGNILWQSDLEASFTATPSIYSNHIFLGSIEGSVFALDETSGAILWKKEINKSVFSSIVLDGLNQLYFGSYDGSVYVLDGRIGNILWETNLGNYLKASSVIDKRYVVYTTADGKMYAFKSSNNIPQNPTNLYINNKTNIVSQGTNIKFQWDFIDLDVNDYQTAFQVKLEQYNNNITNIAFLSEQIISRDKFLEIANLNLEDNTYYYFVRVWDNYRDCSLWSDEEHYIIIDKTIPVINISNIENGGVYDQDELNVLISIYDKNIDMTEVSINGQNEIADRINSTNVEYDLSLTNFGYYTISVYAVDKAGNESRTNLTIRKRTGVYVSKVRGSDNNPGTKELPFKTIQKGIDFGFANNYDSVYIAEGRYRENVKLKDPMSLYGGWSDDFSQQNFNVYITKINGSKNKPNLTIENCKIEPVIEGIKISGGWASKGRGVYCENSSNVLFNYVKVDKNESGRGAGFYIVNSSVSIRNSEITRNESAKGSAVYAQVSSIELVSNIIEHNDSWSKGNVYIEEGSLLARHNLIGDNESGGGTGFWVKNSTANVVHNQIINNDGWGKGGGVYAYNSSISIMSNEISGNEGSKGGAICIEKDSTGVIVNNVISNNKGWGEGVGISISRSTIDVVHNIISKHKNGSHGGGIDVDRSEVNIVDNQITECRVWSSGGGIHLKESSGRIENNIIKHNYSEATGGGISVKNSEDLIIKGNSIISNSCDWKAGGGISVENGKVILSHNVIRGNKANSSGSAVSLKNSESEVYNNLMLNNGKNKHRDKWDAVSVLILKNDKSKIVNNSFIDNKEKVIEIQGSSRAIIVNNIISGGDWGIIRWSGSVLALRNNCFYDILNSKYYYEANRNKSIDTEEGLNGLVNSSSNIVRNPEVVSDGLLLSASSVCIDSGIVGTDYITKLTNDINGIHRPVGDRYDIGCTEYKENVIDTESPEIVINTPVENAILDSYIVVISGIASDESGIANVKVKLDSSDWVILADKENWQYEIELGNGSHTVYVRAIDNFGNEGEVERHFTIDVGGILLDTEPPVITVEPIILPTRNDVVLQYSVTDNKTAPANIIVTGDESPYTTEGEYNVRLVAIDEAGNSNSVLVSFVIDKTSPVINVDAVPLYTSEDVSLSYNVSDNISLPENIVVRGDNSPYTIEGQYDVRLVVVDEAGNSNEAFVHFAIDKTAPVISVSGVEDGEIYNTDKQANITVYDDNLDTYTSVLDGALYNSGNIITTEGTHQLNVTAQDKAENMSIDNREFVIDKIIPGALYVVNPREGESFTENSIDIKWNKGYDTGSGIAYYEVEFDGVLANAGLNTNYIVIDLTLGSHTVRVRGIDKAGNVGLWSDLIHFDRAELGYPADAVFVSPEGDDANPGTYDLPFKTIEKAMSVLDGVNRRIVYINGVYANYELNITNTTGTKEKPIIFRAWNEGWVLHNENDYAIKITKDGVNNINFEGLQINGKGISIKANVKNIEFISNKMVGEGQDFGIDIKPSSKVSNLRIVNSVMSNYEKFIYVHGKMQSLHITNSRLDGASQEGIFVFTGNPDGIIIEKSEIKNCGEYGVYLMSKSKNVRIYDTIFENTGQEAFFAQNKIDDSFVFVKNKIKDTSDTAVYLMNKAEDVVFQSNVIVDSGRQGFFAQNKCEFASPVIRNIIVGNTDSAFYLMNKANEFEMRNNTIEANNGSEIVWLNTKDEIIFKNNIVLGRGDYGVYDNNGNRVLHSYNDVYNVNHEYYPSGRGTGDISENVLFETVDRENWLEDDFYKPVAGSPVIDAGDPKDEVPPDAGGGARIDIGAKER